MTMDIDDHRAIGNRLDLFHQQEEGPGMVFWHPRGFAVYRVVEDYIRRRMRRAGFREIRTPELLSRALWEQSGHWDKFGDNMFVFADGERSFALKPMSCPGHLQVFNKRIRSHRDLPIRYAEFGACHRNEPSGALLGLARTRAFVQDDAHVFCLEEHVVPEVVRFCELLRRVYADFGFADFAVAFSTRPPVRAGADALWDRAEALLAEAASAAGLAPRLQPGDGAFYGPKLEFILQDRQGRAWQYGTIQLDFVLPERLDAAYIDAGNRRARPVMLHHAVLGSLERFLAMLLEHYRGNLPLWLAPEQVVVASIGEAQAAYARRVAQELERDDLRIALDIRPERLARKIVDARENGIPVLIAVGRKEEQDGSVNLRYRNGRQSSVPLSEAIDALRSDAALPAFNLLA
jgi:threonyl-tRNA synthetase